MPEFVYLAALGIGSAVICWGTIWVFLRWALKKRILDFPNERSSHSRPTPTGAGMGIVLVAAAAGAGWLIDSIRLPQDGVLSGWRIGLVLGGSFLIAAISWLDDLRRGLSPMLRLSVHAVGAVLAVFALGGWSQVDLPILGMIFLGGFGLLVVLIWITGLVNAYNFMDGIDGIAGAQAVTAAAGWIAVGLMLRIPAVATCGVVFGGTAIGFLVYNWPPAKIFMGDIGSAFLGYGFAVLPLLAGRLLDPVRAARLPVAGALMVAPFVADTSFTLLRRLVRRENLSQAHRSHLYQRLVRTGLSHQRVTLLYFVLGLFGSAAGIIFIFLPDRTIASLIVVATIMLIWLVPLIWALSREQ